MDPRKQLNKLADQISDLIPADIKSLKSDFDEHLKTLLQSTFSQMNLVTREEFDIQSQLLERTREKLEALEKQLNELEK